MGAAYMDLKGEFGWEPRKLAQAGSPQICFSSRNSAANEIEEISMRSKASSQPAGMAGTVQTRRP